MDGVTVPVVEWLGGVLLPKILQWSQEAASVGAVTLTMKQSLIPLDKYSSLYLEMKGRYGQPLIKVRPSVMVSLSHGYSIELAREHGSLQVCL